MPQPDQPDAGRSDPDSRAVERARAQDLSARLLRLPAAHPSGDRGTSAAAGDSWRGSRPEPLTAAEEPERENWWERGPGPAEPRPGDWRPWQKDRRSRPDGTESRPDAWEDSGPGDVVDSESGVDDDTAAGQGSPGESDEVTGPEDGTAAEPGTSDGGRAGRGSLAARGGRPIGLPAASRDSYRPWFTADSAPPWFASGSAAVPRGQDSLLAGADGALPVPDDAGPGPGRTTPGG